MKIDSAPAKVATASANIAQATAKPATDGAPISTDDAASVATGFQAIFRQLSQQISSENVAAQPQATEPTDALNLPNHPDVPPAATLNQQIAADLPAKELPKKQPCALKEENVPPQPPPDPTAPAKAIPNFSANLKIEDSVPESDEAVTDKPSDAKSSEEKPEKNSQIHCDSATVLPPVAMQPIEIANSPAPQDSQDAAPPIPQSNGQRKSPQAERIALPLAKEPDELPARQIQAQRAQPQIEPAQIQDELPEEVPVAAKDNSSAAPQKRSDTPKLDFSLPQLHLAPKDVDQPAPPPPVSPEQAFIQANHPKIVSTIHGELLPNGGSMHIRMDPPELGALNVQIDVRDGIVNASFQTSNDEATRLLSHSLGQLRTTLESAGVTVEKLQVQQAPREHFNSNSRDGDRPAGQQAYERSAHDDRQRREMLQRMWRRLTVGRDELDLVA